MTDTLADLEARIADDPDDLDAWLVLADLLQKRGDPQGELIALQIAADKVPAETKKAPARMAFIRAFAKHAPKLIEPLRKHGASFKDPYAEPYVWRTGFVRRAVITGPLQQPYVVTPEVVMAAADLLALPAGRFLTELTFHTSRSSDVSGLLDALTAHPPRALQELDLVAWCYPDQLSAIWQAVPRLRRISITAADLKLDGLELPEARRAAFLAGRLTTPALAAIAAAPWPVLERLEVRAGAANTRWIDDGGAVEEDDILASFEDVAPLLRRSDLPALTHLRIRKASFAGGVLRALCESPLAGQLEVIDLSGGTLTPQDIAYASQRKAVFAKLRELWVPPLDQWPGVVKNLEGMAKHVITRAPLDVFDQKR
jgi:uncharacterized protein (TIGR02996 family)